MRYSLLLCSAFVCAYPIRLQTFPLTAFPVQLRFLPQSCQLLRPRSCLVLLQRAHRPSLHHRCPLFHLRSCLRLYPRFHRCPRSFLRKCLLLLPQFYPRQLPRRRRCLRILPRSCRPRLLLLRLNPLFRPRHCRPSGLLCWRRGLQGGSLAFPTAPRVSLRHPLLPLSPPSGNLSNMIPISIILLLC